MFIPAIGFSPAVDWSLRSIGGISWAASGAAGMGTEPPFPMGMSIGADCEGTCAPPVGIDMPSIEEAGEFACPEWVVRVLGLGFGDVFAAGFLAVGLFFSADVGGVGIVMPGMCICAEAGSASTAATAIKR